ncbi:MAG: hypothetical protein Q8K86_10125 [Candidatus Nanopelagicaceae bacterium]|nr:hypothetical protein [Candidatus Nanopelagicaceae bacterium]
MSNYLTVVALITLANMLPAFAPPTWSLLVFFTLRHQMNPVALVLAGVASATMGRAVLAYTFRAIRNWLPKGYVANMEAAGAQIEKNPRRVFGLLTLFFISPLSSAQLFEAAGIIKRIALKPLLIAFAGGRLISYSFYVSGASALKDSSLGKLITREITSPWAIAIQVLFILALVALGNVKWNGKKAQPV